MWNPIRIVLPITLLVGGCATAVADEVQLPEPVDATSVNLPVTHASNEVQALLLLSERAEDMYIEICMNEQGYEFIPVPPSQVPPEVGISDEGRHLTISETATDGYNSIFAADEEPPAELRLQQQLVESFTDTERREYLLAFWGADEQSGCLGEARRNVVPERARMHTIENRLQSAALRIASETGRDAATLKIRGEWSNCMSKAGYDFSDPEAAMDFAWEDLRSAAPDALHSSHKPVQQELELAMADAECQSAVQYRGIDEVRARIDQSELPKLRDIVEEWDLLRPQVADRLADTVGSDAVDTYMEGH